MRCYTHARLEGLDDAQREMANRFGKEQSNGATLLQNMIHYSANRNGDLPPDEIDPMVRLRREDDVLHVFSPGSKGNRKWTIFMLGLLREYLELDQTHVLLSWVEIERGEITQGIDILRPRDRVETVDLDGHAHRRLLALKEWER